MNKNIIFSYSENAIFDVSASDSSETRRTSKPKQTFHADLPGLQCYSCGSLLNPNKKCDEFSRTDKNQVQTCLKDEACLMYSWKKSPTETGKKKKTNSFLSSRSFCSSSENPLMLTIDL